MASKILISIALDGDSEVKRKLQEVGEAGKRSLDNIDNKLKSGGGKNTGLAELQQQATGLRAALAPLSEASGLSGLLGAAGLGGILARFATGPAGIFSGLTAGALGLAKIGEDTQRLKSRLTGLGDAKGFETLSASAKQLGTDVASLQPRYERFLQFEQQSKVQNVNLQEYRTHTLPGEPGYNEETYNPLVYGTRNPPPPRRDVFQKFDSALLKQIRRDVNSPTDAQQIASQFQESLFSAGTLTADSLRQLQKSSPNAANFVTQQLRNSNRTLSGNPAELARDIERGRISQGDLTPASVINAGAKPNAEFEKAADSARGVTQAFEGLTAAAGRLLEKLGGDHAGLTPGLDRATGLVDQTGPLLDQLAANRAETGPKSLGEVFSSDKGDLMGRLVGYLRQSGETGGASGGNPFGDIVSSLKRAFTDPGSFQEKTRPPEPPPATYQSLTPAPAAPPPPEAPIDYTDGRRFSRQLNPSVGEVGDAGRDLAAAITGAATAVRNATSGNSTQTVQQRAGGGAVFGAGTATSDSIPAMLSHGEYVINANSASKIGLRNLDLLNRSGGGAVRLAEGGSPSGATTDLSGGGSFNVEATDDGGAIINGVKYSAGAPILSIPAIAQALARSRAQKAQDGKKTHKSDFVGLFGGHNFDTPGSYAKGGAIGRLMHFASGGIMPDFSAGSAPSLSDDLAAPGGGSLGHMDVNLSTNWGDFKMKATPDVARAMAAAARDAADVQTGPRPSWYDRGK